MKNLDKKKCSVFCLCIKDIVKLEECQRCSDYSIEKGSYEYEDHKK